ncbi:TRANSMEMBRANE PROTEIN [Salix koriyanagi]|uniref:TRANSMEMBRANE PROTEIN n=1 Tax=Salix koriyanagi TaxID=2511006 RepID=A0A9Q0V062_9ROSI|nr:TRANSMEMBRANE PROTEIN [Salix koriyanagi]
MDRNGVSRLFLLFSVLIFSSGVSNASFISMNWRLTALKDHGGNSSVKIQVSPSPSPDSAKTLNTTNTEDNSVSKVDNPTSLHNNNNNNNNNNRSNDERGFVGLNSTRGNEKESANEKRDDETKNVSEEKDHRKPDLESEVGGENCTTLGGRSTCLIDSCRIGTYEEQETNGGHWTVLIQNSGEHNLSVDVLAPNPVDYVLVEIEKQQTKMINLTVGQSTEVILNAKNGGCVLHLDPPESQANFFVNLPSFDKLITPINGAYFLIITVVVFGGTLACCMCWKGRLEAGIFYQELEMAMPESGVETAGGWDNDWDDSWDEENEIKSPPARHSASVLANALTSRTPNKDGWENDWDRDEVNWGKQKQYGRGWDLGPKKQKQKMVPVIQSKKCNSPLIYGMFLSWIMDMVVLLPLF